MIGINQLLDLSIDGIFIITQLVLTNIGRSIKFICLVILDNRTAEDKYRGLDNVMSHYNRAVFL